MNIRILLIAVMMLINNFSVAMNVKKDNPLKDSNIYDLLDEETEKIVTEIKIPKKVKKVLIAAAEVLNQKKEKTITETNLNHVSLQDNADVLETLTDVIKIHDKVNKIEIYILPTAPSLAKPIKYTQNINTWLEDSSIALQDDKYIDPNNKRFIHNKKKEKEAITIHAFSKLVDPYIFNGKSISEIDRSTRKKVTKFVLPAIIREEGSNQDRECCLVYIFNSWNQCFHRNISFDTTQYDGQFPYIKVPYEFPGLPSNK